VHFGPEVMTMVGAKGVVKLKCGLERPSPARTPPAHLPLLPPRRYVHLETFEEQEMKKSDTLCDDGSPLCKVRVEVKPAGVEKIAEYLQESYNVRPSRHVCVGTIR